MIKYEINQVINEFKNHQEGVIFDISDEGASILVFFENPTNHEIAQFKSGKRFEIRFLEIYEVIMMTVKIGELNWMDAPYTPHLSKNLTQFQIPKEGQGLTVTLFLIDAILGEIKHIRMIGLSENFTKKLLNKVIEHMGKDFNKNEYDHLLQKIFSVYTTNQIVKLSKDYCKIN